MKKRNNAIEFFRFLFCCVICIHHLNIFGYGEETVFKSGYLCVDMFFVLSGYFLMDHFVRSEKDSLRSPEQSAFAYLLSRLKTLGPHHVFSWVVMAFITVFVLKSYSASDVLLYGCWEFLLLKSTGLGTNITVNGVVWYLSALVLSGYIIYWLLCRERARRQNEGQGFSRVIAPIIYFAVMSYIWKEIGDLNYWTQSAPLLAGGFWRGFAEMCLGCTAYAAVEGIRAGFKPGKHNAIFATVFELLGWALIFYHMYKQRDQRDFVVPALAAVLFISCMVNDSYITRLLDNPCSAFLGRISYPMYLNQFIFIRPIIKFLPPYPFWTVALLALTGIFVLSLFTERLVGKITAGIEKSVKASRAA